MYTCAMIATEVPSIVMGRPETKSPDAKKRDRIFVKITKEAEDMLREMAYVWNRTSIELMAGLWLEERIEQEYKAGRKAADAKKKK